MMVADLGCQNRERVSKVIRQAHTRPSFQELKYSSFYDVDPAMGIAIHR
jgi:hypothetical protein